MIALVISLTALAAWSIVATLHAVSVDGYRRIPTLG
jgi:hypothetical protein